jgi:ATP-dependent DNA helicase RecG
LGKELGIFTYGDLANFFPNRYIDRTKFYKIKELNFNSSEVQVVGKVLSFKEIKQKKGSRLVANFIDDTGKMELVWFRGAKWIKENIKINVLYVIFGKVNQFKGAYTMPHPEIELLSEYKKGFKTVMQPIYRSTEMLSNRGVSNRVMQKLVQQLFIETKGRFEETLSDKIMSNQGLISKNEAMLNIHFPQSQELLTKAEYRLKFEELFFIQLQLIVKKLVRKQKNKGYVFEKVGDHFHEFYDRYLPFELTNAQKRVLKEIRRDLNTGAQMNRLLQGDVGSGKTIVAVLCMLIALDNNYQTALIAPTEILAKQHFNAIEELVQHMPVKVRLLTGSSTAAQRRTIHAELESGDLHIIIGTHAIFEDKVKFTNLGLAIIDEQHRFGVAQRAKMWMKNELPPHILVMTATPIPRTLAMSVYGDLDISVIDELPPGRKAIKTIHRYDSNRLSVFKFIKDEVAKGCQVYIVYPLIQESEQLDYKDLMDGYESISREFPLPDYRISIVHGKMKSADKDYEMKRFVKGETQIMVATTVIEVGVNVPNASIMIIESAERFGLSQLHQLRGRVGRGADQSYCVLMSSIKLSKEAKTRLQTMVETNDGFKIAEVDLKLRGPGNLMGTQQSGVLNLRIADIIQDEKILYLARKAAMEVAGSKLGHKDPAHRNIWMTYEKISRNSAIWRNIS